MHMGIMKMMITLIRNIVVAVVAVGTVVASPLAAIINRETEVGSNNINLLVPSGQFGTRLQGGKDTSREVQGCSA